MLAPMPLLLAEGTVNATMSAFKMPTFEMLEQPTPEQAADDVVKLPPVSTPLFVTPRSKFPPDKFIVICKGEA
jgi:hypothetical protein